MVSWGSKIEIERSNRIRLSVACYAYEVENDPILSDEEFDSLCISIDMDVDTGNILLDNFFRNEFNPFTGLWIYKHPQLDKIKNLYNRFYAL